MNLTKRQLRKLDAMDKAFDKILLILNNTKVDTQGRVIMRTEDLSDIRSGNIYPTEIARVSHKNKF